MTYTLVGKTIKNVMCLRLQRKKNGQHWLRHYWCAVNKERSWCAWSKYEDQKMQ